MFDFFCLFVFFPALFSLSMQVHKAAASTDASSRHTNRYVVVSVPFFLADDNNDVGGDNFLDLFWDDLPPSGEQQILEATSLNVLSALFPDGSGGNGGNGGAQTKDRQLTLTSDSFYFYSGSSTSPPCTENVKYILIKSKIFEHRITNKQLSTLSSIMMESSNARPVQNEKWPHKSSESGNGAAGDYLEVLTKSKYVGTGIQPQPQQPVVAAAALPILPQPSVDAAAPPQATPPVDGEATTATPSYYAKDGDTMSNEASETLSELTKQ